MHERSDRRISARLDPILSLCNPAVGCRVLRNPIGVGPVILLDRYHCWLYLPNCFLSSRLFRGCGSSSSLPLSDHLSQAFILRRQFVIPSDQFAYVVALLDAIGPSLFPVLDPAVVSPGEQVAHPLERHHTHLLKIDGEEPDLNLVIVKREPVSELVSAALVIRRQALHEVAVMVKFSATDESHA